MDLKIKILQLIRMYKIEIELCKCYCECAEGKYLHKHVLGKYKLTEITKYISEFLHMSIDQIRVKWVSLCNV